MYFKGRHKIIPPNQRGSFFLLLTDRSLASQIRLLTTVTSLEEMAFTTKKKKKRWKRRKKKGTYLNTAKQNKKQTNKQKTRILYLFTFEAKFIIELTIILTETPYCSLFSLRLLLRDILARIHLLIHILLFA